VGTASERAGSAKRVPAMSTAGPSRVHHREPVLETAGLSRRFGGLAAVDGVSIACRHGEVHAVIGPNGAGKSTLINLLSGDLRPSQGTVRLFGRDVTGLSPDAISRLGVGRSYQKTNVFLPFTVFENCRLAAQSRMGTSMRFVRPAHAYPSVADAARRALAAVGLEARADDLVATLSHGEQRQVEIAMTLATSPRVLLLDEPLAGTGAEESRAIVALGIAALGAWIASSAGAAASSCSSCSTWA